MRPSSNVRAKINSSPEIPGSKENNVRNAKAQVWYINSVIK